MSQFIDKTIEKLKNENEELHKKHEELWGKRCIYKTKRPDFLGTTMILTTMIPIFFVLFLAAFGTAKLGWSINTGRLVILGSIIFTTFVVAPIVVWFQQRGFSNFFKGKNRTEIVCDDFAVYDKRVDCVRDVVTNNKTIEKLKKEKQRIKDKEELLGNLSSEYNISKKDKPVVDNAAKIKELETLNEKYEEQLSVALQEYKVMHFFKPVFKYDKFQDFANSMLGGVLAMLLWNLPAMTHTMSNGVNTQTSDTIWDFLFLLLQSMLPAIIVAFCPLVLRKIEKNYYVKSFDIINKTLVKPLDTMINAEDAFDKYDEEVDNIQEEIALNRVKIELLKNNM